MTTTKFSKAFGEVEILNQDATTTTVKIVKTGEVKKLLNQYANLSNEPFVKVAKKKEVVRELTQEDKDHLQYLYATGQTMAATLEASRKRYRAGKSGAASL
jgi:pyruvate formate-lyase activating enzyme-like uncharacterized protein